MDNRPWFALATYFDPKPYRRRFIAAASMLALAGCASAPQDNLTACTEALFAAGTINPSRLLSVAEATPACVALGKDIINGLIHSVGAKQAARGVRQ